MIGFINANANVFIIKHDGLIDQRAQGKINEIGTEANTKLNTNIYIYIVENNGINMKKDRESRIKQIRQFDEIIIKKLPNQNNYAILVLSIDQLYANILLSKNLKDIVNKREILDEYVIPLLASKDKNTLFAKTSAAALNGYAQIADSIANSKNIKLDSSIGSGGKTAGTIWKVFMYSLVLFGIIAYAIIVMRQRKTS